MCIRDRYEWILEPEQAHYDDVLSESELMRDMNTSSNLLLEAADVSDSGGAEDFARKVGDFRLVPWQERRPHFDISLNEQAAPEK